MRKSLRRTAFIVLTFSFISAVSCVKGNHPSSNLVLVTIESLRADRLTRGPIEPDPVKHLRVLAASGSVRRVLSSSSEALPSLASLFSGLSPGRHGTMVEGLDRLPESFPTLAGKLAAAGWRTGGFPSMASLGLSSGLSRGFESYGWPASDQVRPGTMAATDGKDWVAAAGRRPGEATVVDALAWVARHRSERFFLWVHLSDAAPPYATDKRLISQFPGSLYDAAIAYDDRCLKTLVDGIAAAGLEDRTTYVVAGDHGESLGAHNESLHGLNLYPPSLETVVVIAPPSGSKQAASETARPSGAAPPVPAKIAAGALGRLIDLHATILDLAGVASVESIDARPGAPPLSPEAPLFAATLGPRAAFGWNGRIGLYDGDWAWAGNDEEELYHAADGRDATENRISEEPDRAARMRSNAGQIAGTLASRLVSRKQVPPPAVRARVIEMLQSVTAIRENATTLDQVKVLQEAHALDPGNFQIATMIATSGGAKSPEATAELVRELEQAAPDLPETALAVSHIFDASRAPEKGVEAIKRACASGAVGCQVELALRLSRIGQHEEAAALLATVAAKSVDADIHRTLGDIYFNLQNTYRAAQAYDKAATLRPGDPDILIRQGDCLAATKDFKGATGKYEAARASLPGLKLVELRLGNVAQQQGDRRSAVEHYRRGLDLDTNTASGALVLARVLAERGLLEEAMPLFEDAASRDTRSGAADYFAAETLAAAGKLSEAEAHLKRSLDRDPTNPTALYQLARLVVHRGDNDQGARLLVRLAEHAPPKVVMAALQDPIFSGAPPGSPLRQGLETLRQALQKAAAAGPPASFSGPASSEVPARPPSPPGP